MNRSFWKGSGMLVAWLFACGLAARVDPSAYTGGRARDEQARLRRNSSAVAAIFGEFRTSLSDIMFIKTERYLHGGIAYRPHHDEAALSVEELADEVEEHLDELGIPDDGEAEHVGVPTILPMPDQDFRGWIGHLHRTVKPWRDPAKAHIHTDGRELLPWFRIMTRTDPQYVRGYLAGSFWLERMDHETALDFVEEGLRHNPEAFQLLVTRGLMQIREARRQMSTGDEPQADRLRRAAYADFRHAAELALQQRPDDVDEEGFGSGDWGRYHEHDAIAAANMSVMLAKDLDHADTAAALRQRYRDLLRHREE